MADKKIIASEQYLQKLFTLPEQPDSTLARIDSALSENLYGFLAQHIVASNKSLQDIEQRFSGFRVPDEPQLVSDHTRQMLNSLVADSVHTSSPYFIGHMTSALPSFHLSLAKLMMGLNQNQVKIETSKAFTPMEQQVLGMLHHLIYHNNEQFYQQYLHDAEHALGVFCSGGTLANITALWVARNQAFKPTSTFRGVGYEGMHRALKAYDYDDVAILVSQRGHYSLTKAADVLGLGRDQIRQVRVDSQQRMDMDALSRECEALSRQNVKILAIVGIAGTTETGNVDPLQQIAAVADQYDAHFHVDAAWGGATLMSDNYKSLLAGIELADSVTIDAHKQLYVPMGAGVVLFRNPDDMNFIRHHAEYIIRRGSKDLGSKSIEGSRSGIAMLLYSALHIIGRQGYQLLIDNSIHMAATMAGMINRSPDFELMSTPELCILTYRYVPPEWLEALRNPDSTAVINKKLDQLTVAIQKQQRESGKSFVSRTRIQTPEYDQKTVVFRVVLANPLTKPEMLEEVLQHQREIAVKAMMDIQGSVTD